MNYIFGFSDIATIVCGLVCISKLSGYLRKHESIAGKIYIFSLIAMTCTILSLIYSFTGEYPEGEYLADVMLENTVVGGDDYYVTAQTEIYYDSEQTEYEDYFGDIHYRTASINTFYQIKGYILPDGVYIENSEAEWTKIGEESYVYNDADDEEFTTVVNLSDLKISFMDRLKAISIISWIIYIAAFGSGLITFVLWAINKEVEKNS